MNSMQIESFNGRKLVAGVDEVGRGPLAGPVVAAAVILDDNNRIEGLGDSKTIPEKKRHKLALEIQQKSIAWAIGQVEHEEIDELNILNACLLCAGQRVYKNQTGPCIYHSPVFLLLYFQLRPHQRP